MALLSPRADVSFRFDEVPARRPLIFATGFGAYAFSLLKHYRLFGKIRVACRVRLHYRSLTNNVPRGDSTLQTATKSKDDHVNAYFRQVGEVAAQLDHSEISRAVEALVALREREGRLFFVGVGGSAANCSHAVNDFRKLCGIEAYAPTDNVSELTARTNDEGWETVFSEWLSVSHAHQRDAVFVMSVGGGNVERGVSVNIVRALEYAKSRNMTIFGIVGRDGGYTKRVGDHVVVVPTVDQNLVTPHTEAFHAVVWHCLVSHPRLQKRATKW
jgi:D-sedoheptulose 7-phosphate isomerase